MPASNFGTRLAGGLQDIIPLLMSLQQRQDMLGQQSIENKRAKTQEQRAEEIFQLQKDIAQSNRLQKMLDALQKPVDTPEERFLWKYSDKKPEEIPQLEMAKYAPEMYRNVYGKDKGLSGVPAGLDYLINTLHKPPEEAIQLVYGSESKPGKTSKDYGMQLLMSRLGQTRKTDVLGESRTEPIGLPEAAASADSLMNLLQYGQFTRPPEPTFSGAPMKSLPRPSEEKLPVIETRAQLEEWYKTSKHPNKEYIYQQALKDPELR